MRHYAPASVEDVLAELLTEPSFAGGVLHHEVIAARAAQTAPLPDWLDPRIRAALAERGIAELYVHQAAAIEAVRAGEDIVVVTPTASGKTLCYALPTLQALADDPAARALFLFPTKALGQDQVAELSELARAADLGISAATYDGDTPAPIRSAIRTAGQVVVTNPDMLHSAILPHHTKWFQLFEQLRIIVIDELHTYRGVFGSHVANVLRRLLRLCAHYGSQPVIVCCSATIGNPGELAQALTGRPSRLIDRNGAPSGLRHLLLVEPPLLDPATGARGSALTLAQRWALPFLRAGRQTIVFGRSRVAVEIILTGLREALRESFGPRKRVRGYRGGYLPTERRSIERGLRDGELLGVVSTNALELGVDVGRLDVSILAGYPGSIAATWQQIGRAGRRNGTSAAVLVASAAPVDRYVVGHPEFLLEGAPEEARIDPDNLHVLLAHLRAATFERPFEPGEVFGPAPADDLLEFLAEEGHVRQAGDGRWYWSSENFPASEISLRTAAPENVVIIDTTPDRPRVIGEVDLFSAQVLVHEQAIYLHESVQYHVDKLDWHERKAYVRRVDADYYTYANRAVTLKPLDVFADQPRSGGRRVHGEVMVASLVTLFKKLKFGTDENVGWGPIDLPELELQTTASWLVIDQDVATNRAGPWRRDELDVALVGAGRAIQTVASVLLMVDPRDLGLVTQVRSPHQEAPTIYLYEAVPGGVGFERAAVRADRRARRRRCRADRALRVRDRLPGLHRSAARTGRRCEGPGAPPPRRRRSPWTGRRDRGRHSGMTDAARLGRRLADLRSARDAARADQTAEATRRGAVPEQLRRQAEELAERLATVVDGEWVSGPTGGYVRVEPPPIDLPIDRERLGQLPDGAPPDVPLVCLDTETTGLVTGTGTVAFLVGLGTWAGDRFCQVQLLLPDHAAEPALLDALASAIPAGAWLVTYNGRGFDWPLLVGRYRMNRRAPPAHAGHLDLLPFVRRVFRHRLTDARLKTVETELLGFHRGRDLDGSEIPGRYLQFLRGGTAWPLAEVVRHNHEDVRSLARLLAHAEARLGAEPERRMAPVGDLAGLARSFRRVGLHDEALDCLDVALEAPPERSPARRSWSAILTTRADAPDAQTSRSGGYDRELLLVERARLLRRLGRHAEALATWRDLGLGGGPWAGVGWIEVAKILEHRLGDPVGALEACGRAERIADRARSIGTRLPRLETDLGRRRRRLVRRIAGQGGGRHRPPASPDLDPIPSEPAIGRPLPVSA